MRCANGCSTDQKDAVARSDTAKRNKADHRGDGEFLVRQHQRRFLHQSKELEVPERRNGMHSIDQGIPCITLRSTTERPVTVTEGTNQLFNGKLAELPDVVREALTRARDPVFPHLWDGSGDERRPN